MKLLYILFLQVYRMGIGVASLWNKKARQWISGRRQFPAIPISRQQTVWMHCASLGEFEQGRPLLEAIKKQYPQSRIVLTFFSPSGYEVMKKYTGADYIFYLPMDGPARARRMVAAINPALVLWVKYEFWYYYLTEFKKRQIPVLMVSGLFRQGQPFFSRYGHLWRQMLQSFHWLFVQNEESAQLLGSIGIQQNLSIGGDTRFDRVIEIAQKFEPLPLIQQFCGNSKVLVAGSTWEDDEAELVHYVRTNPGIKFIIAPHEIDAGNIRDVQQTFKGALLYSELAAGTQAATGAHVLIIDNIGMLSRLYQYAHLTFVGGGFEASGIHNVLEPAVYGKPVIFGPEYEKFAEAVELVELGAAMPVNNALELEALLSQLWHDEKMLQEKSSAARKYVFAKAGATQKVMDYIQANRLLTS